MLRQHWPMNRSPATVSPDHSLLGLLGRYICLIAGAGTEQPKKEVAGVVVSASRATATAAGRGLSYATKDTTDSTGHQCHEWSWRIY